MKSQIVQTGFCETVVLRNSRLAIGIGVLLSRAIAAPGLFSAWAFCAGPAKGLAVQVFAVRITTPCQTSLEYFARPGAVERMRPRLTGVVCSYRAIS